MDQNQTLNSDLQKAIDDITNTTSVDPVFSDPVAAPSSVPEGDTGAMGEAVGPFPAPEPIVPEPPVMNQASMPEINMPPMPMPSIPSLPATEKMPSIAEVQSMPEIQQYAAEVPPMPEFSNFSQTPQNMRQVRESALRDLAPLLGHMTINPSQKFRIYRDMFEDLHDYAVLEPAYQAAKAIADEKERGEALLYLIESIDRI